MRCHLFTAAALGVPALQAAERPPIVGIANIGLKVDDLAEARKFYSGVRAYQPPQPPNIARDGRWLLQLFDKNFTRTEMMVRKPVQTPCSSPNRDDFTSSPTPATRSKK